MYCTGTFSTINCSFEATLSPLAEEWFAVQAVRTNANTVELTTGNLSAAPAYAWELSVNAYARVRVRATARTSGTQNWTILPGTYATEPIPAAQVTATQSISGTVTANLGSAGAGFTDTTANLGIGATFTGTVRDLGTTLGVFKDIDVVVYANQPSAANGVEIRYSTDNFATFFTVATGTLVANTPLIFKVTAVARYWRVVVTNGGVAQTFFRVLSRNSRT
jgi:hypothetical protein